MNIDINRVNLSEKDIEDWLYANPKVLYAMHEKNPIVRWIGRQYQLPSGIADLIGVREDGMLVVVEVKNVAINKAAVLQVCRYAEDLKHIVCEREYPHYDAASREPEIEMVLIGPSIDPQTFTEARAVWVRVFQFSAELHLDVSSLTWTEGYREAVQDHRESIAMRPEWDIYGSLVRAKLAQIRDGDGEIEPASDLDHQEIATDAEERFKLAAKYAREYHAQELAAKATDEYDELLKAIASEQDAPEGDDNAALAT